MQSNHMERMHIWSSSKNLIEDLRLSSNVAVTVTKNRKIFPPKDDSGQVWFKLTQWFQRRRFLKKFTDGQRTPSDGNSSHM
jgi:hypothetical protein